MKVFHKYLKEYFNQEEDEIASFIDSNDINLDKDVVENIIAIVNKTLNDWNREKMLDGEEIEKIIKKGLESHIIKVS